MLMFAVACEVWNLSNCMLLRWKTCQEVWWVIMQGIEFAPRGLQELSSMYTDIDSMYKVQAIQQFGLRSISSHCKKELCERLSVVLTYKLHQLPTCVMDKKSSRSYDTTFVCQASNAFRQFPID